MKRRSPEGLKTGCILPLVSRNRILGVLSLGRREQNGFGRADIGFLTQVASQISIAVENASAYSEIAHARAELEKALEEIQRLKDRLQDENLVLREQMIKLSCLRRLWVLLPRCEQCFLAYPR